MARNRELNCAWTLTLLFVILVTQNKKKEVLVRSNVDLTERQFACVQERRTEQ